MELPITIEVLKKAKYYLARIPELDFVSQGRTLDEAKKNVMETLHIQFAEMQDMGTLHEYLEECGYIEDQERVDTQTEIVSFEKSLAMV